MHRFILALLLTVATVSAQVYSLNGNDDVQTSFWTSSNVERTIAGLNAYAGDEKLNSALVDIDLSEVQPLNDNLTAIAGLSYSGPPGSYAVALKSVDEDGEWSSAPFSNLAIGLMVQTSQAAMRGVLGFPGTSAAEYSYLIGVTGSIQSQINTKLAASNGTLGSNLAAGGFKITGLGTPTSTTDSATKGYVDGRVLAATPASATATGSAGQIAYDETYLYICIATNTWRRVLHETW